MPLYAIAPDDFRTEEGEEIIVSPGGVYCIRSLEGDTFRRNGRSFEFVGNNRAWYFSVERSSSWLRRGDGSCGDWEIIEAADQYDAQEVCDNRLRVTRHNVSLLTPPPAISLSQYVDIFPTTDYVISTGAAAKLSDFVEEKKVVELTPYHTWLGLKEAEPINFCDEEDRWIMERRPSEVAEIMDEWCDHPFSKWMKREFYSWMRFDEGLQTDWVSALMYATAMMPSKDDPTKVAFYPDIAKREANRRVKARPGKAFRQLFPMLSERRIDQLVDMYKRAFIPADYNFTVGETREDFKRAYTAKSSDMQNLQCNSIQKSLAHSCMQGMDGREWAMWGSGDWHPAEVYASGDFEIACLWIGKTLSARVICHKEQKNYGPIYAHGENALNQMKKHLGDRGYKGFAIHGDWEGSRLLKIEVPGEAFLTPYLDLDPKGAIDDGDYLIISERCTISLSNTSGRSYSNETSCYHCDELINANDAINFNDDFLCEHCYNESYFTCEMTGEIINVDEMHIVYRRGWSSRNRLSASEQQWGERAVDGYAAECVETGELWYINDMVELYNGDHISPCVFENGERYLSCHLNTGIYPVDEMAFIRNIEEWASLEALRENPEFFEEDGEWFHISDKEEEAA